MWAVILLCVAACSAVYAAPQGSTSSPDKSAFVPAFDEIVVESSLTVRGRSGPTSTGQRQGRTKLFVVPTPGTPIDAKANSTSTSTTTTTSTEKV